MATKRKRPTSTIGDSRTSALGQRELRRAPRPDSRLPPGRPPARLPRRRAPSGRRRIATTHALGEQQGFGPGRRQSCFRGGTGMCAVFCFEASAAQRRSQRARPSSGDEAEARHRRRTPVRLGHRRPVAGLDPDASSWAIGAARDSAVGAVRRHLRAGIDAPRGLLLRSGR
jgi:hypothetical protein